MTTEFVSVPTNYTVGETLQHIREVERTRHVGRGADIFHFSPFDRPPRRSQVS